MRTFKKHVIIALLLTLLTVGLVPSICMGEPPADSGPLMRVGLEEAASPKRVSVVLEIFALLTVLTLAPAILVMLTSFTRIVIVLSILKQALGTRGVPPNQVIIGLALFLTFFIMTPVYDKVNQQAIQPYMKGDITHKEALSKAAEPLRSFMAKQTREKDLGLIVNISNMDRPKNVDDVPTSVLIPSFIISELKTAFQIGFILFVPFLVIDMVVSSVLLSMGMMMLPPVMISLPFKLILFVLVDGWNLIVGSLVKSFG